MRNWVLGYLSPVKILPFAGLKWFWAVLGSQTGRSTAKPAERQLGQTGRKARPDKTSKPA